mmetsp:Transcript_49516/g.129188  ORF Transcript_49516/g.129188 Transcript_49516/m.129188 type:complete len:326 (-) Transcript_49516:235-1212(-)
MSSTGGDESFLFLPCWERTEALLSVNEHDNTSIDLSSSLLEDSLLDALAREQARSSRLELQVALARALAGLPSAGSAAEQRMIRLCVQVQAVARRCAARQNVASEIARKKVWAATMIQAITRGLLARRARTDQRAARALLRLQAAFRKYHKDVVSRPNSILIRSMVELHAKHLATLASLRSHCAAVMANKDVALREQAGRHARSLRDLHERNLGLCAEQQSHQKELKGLTERNSTLEEENRRLRNDLAISRTRLNAATSTIEELVDAARKREALIFELKTDRRRSVQERGPPGGGAWSWCGAPPCAFPSPLKLNLPMPPCPRYPG